MAIDALAGRFSSLMVEVPRHWRCEKKRRESGEMGNCFSPKGGVSPREMHREWKDEEEKRVWQVKVRLTAKQLEELLLQAQSCGTTGPELLRNCIMKGRLEVKELVQGDGGGRGQKKMSKLEAIKEEEI